MQPNLEIRERVAREVMGLKVRWWDGSMRPWVDMEPQDISERRPVPAYEVDIAAAFQVVERWCSVKSELGHANGKNRVNIEIDGVTARVGFCVEIEVEVGYAEHQSLPMAICLAALAAYRATQTKEPRDEKAK